MALGVGKRDRIALAQSGVDAEPSGTAARDLERNITQLDPGEMHARRVERQRRPAPYPDFERLALSLPAQPAHVGVAVGI